MRTAVRLSLVFGMPLTVFVAVSPFYPMDHSLWLRINGAFFAATLGGVALLGWKLGRARQSWAGIGRAMLTYTAVVSALFMAAYLTTTWFFAEDMKWIPFFQRDYLYHGFSSVKAYLYAADNYAELAKLNMFSLMVSSVMYGAVGGLAAAVARRIATQQSH